MPEEMRKQKPDQTCLLFGRTRVHRPLHPHLQWTQAQIPLFLELDRLHLRRTVHQESQTKQLIILS